jgi:hypothetical protein
MNKEKRICPNEKCRKEFLPNHPNQLFCTKKCRWRHECAKRRKFHPEQVKAADLKSAAKPVNRYNRLVDRAAIKGVTCTLSFDQYLELIVGRPCHWCGSTVQTGYGVDRRVNELGYVAENCVPCCATCNYGKRELSPEQFVSWIARVYRKQFLS